MNKKTLIPTEVPTQAYIASCPLNFLTIYNPIKVVKRNGVIMYNAAANGATVPFQNPIVRRTPRSSKFISPSIANLANVTLLNEKSVAISNSAIL